MIGRFQIFTVDGFDGGRGIACADILHRLFAGRGGRRVGILDALEQGSVSVEVRLQLFHDLIPLRGRLLNLADYCLTLRTADRNSAVYIQLDPSGNGLRFKRALHHREWNIIKILQSAEYAAQSDRRSNDSNNIENNDNAE